VENEIGVEVLANRRAAQIEGLACSSAVQAFWIACRWRTGGQIIFALTATLVRETHRESTSRRRQPAMQLIISFISIDRFPSSAVQLAAN
jgi:hypothetical protein